MEIFLLPFIIICVFWTHCNGTECGSPGLPLHGLVDGRSDVPEDRTYPAGAKVKYSCPERGMKLFGNEIRECVDGRWLGSLPWCGSNIIVKKPVITEIDSPHSNRPMVYHIPEIADGVVNERAESHCLLISSEEKHVFKFVDLGKQSVHQMLIYTKKPFPLLNNDWEIDIPTEWSYHVTTKSSSPAIVIENDRSIQVNELAIGIVSQVPLEICEIELYAQTDSFTCGKPEVPAHGRLSFVKIQDVVLQVVHYSCDAGYQIDGPARRTCNGTQWAGSQPVCSPIVHDLLPDNAANEPAVSEDTDSKKGSQDWERHQRFPPTEVIDVDKVSNVSHVGEIFAIIGLSVFAILPLMAFALFSYVICQIFRGNGETGEYLYEKLSCF